MSRAPGYQLVAVEGPARVEEEAGIRATLFLAYQLRSCFVCGVRGFCGHREPTVEWAVAGWRGVGASLEEE